MELSVIMPTKDRGAVFERSLDALLRAIKGRNIEVIIVNDSRQGVPKVPSGHPQIRLYNNPTAGVVTARNFGASMAKSELLLFLDDDILVDERSMQQVIELHRDLPKACSNPDWVYTDEANAELARTKFGRFIQHNRLNSEEGWYNHPSWKRGELFPTQGIASFHLCIRKEDFNAFNGYETRMPNALFDDIDLPHRIRAAGIQPYIHAGIRVYHNEVDRIVFLRWMAHTRRRSYVMRLAVEQGKAEPLPPRSRSGRMFYRSVNATMGFWTMLFRAIPNLRLFDPLSFLLLDGLVAAHIFDGYSAEADDLLHLQAQPSVRSPQVEAAPLVS